MPRIGMLTPSSNTVLEPVTYRLLSGAEEVTAHFSRLPVTAISLADEQRGQFSVARTSAAAELLRDAAVDVVVWNGTAGSWLGFDYDRQVCDALSQVCGVPATTSTLALREAFRAFGVRRLGLVTPYTGDVTARIAETYAAEGVEVVADERLEITDNFSFGEVPEQRLVEMIRAAAPGAQAVALVCTNLRGALAAAELEPDLGIPVLDSVSVTLWQALDLLGGRPLDRGSVLLSGSTRAALREICALLRAATGSDRTTVRLDLPSQRLGVDLAAAEDTGPGVAAIQHDAGLDQRALNTVRWLEEHRKTLVQPHFRTGPRPPQALVDTYGVRAQMLTPVEVDGTMVGWLSVHSLTERDWSPTDTQAVEAASTQVKALLAQNGVNFARN
ncbi:aspartate/glutamate racemase family protein [Saccharopolyspora indica]|uniref:aspartate racemase/maleate isomerase family protein n=1 Tax=Saccharopolyspora indica TaxID=1229659 RepID=UPI0022EAB7C9|nr:aspartate/glutamate racemase family protein [Saccharopolyspora indica]MDA3647358.1 aspartate/glutamate racemase family protein [Saccharopolyspora indica]